MSLWAGCNGTRTTGMVLDTISRPNDGESLRQAAERKLAEYQAMMPSAKVWISSGGGYCFLIRTSSRKLRDLVCRT